MPGAEEHSPRTRRKICSLVDDGFACPIDVAARISTLLPFGTEFSVSSARRIIKLYQETGQVLSDRQIVRHAKDVIAKQRVKQRPERIPNVVRAFIFTLYTACALLTGEEVKRKIWLQHEFNISLSSVASVRASQNFNRRRNDRARPGFDPVTQSQWKQMFEDMEIEEEHLLFIDETHKNSKDFFRTYGYYQPGRRAWTPIDPRSNISASYSTLATFSVDGMIDWHTVTLSRNGAFGQPKAIDTTDFLYSFCKVVLPYIGNWNRREPRSLVICDNATLHHDDVGLLEKLVASRGGRLLYLPQYSPELNPIEMGFKSVNDYIRKHHLEVEVSDDAGFTVLQDAFASVDGRLGRAYFDKMWTILRQEVV